MKNTLDLLRLTAKIIESWEAAPAPEIERDVVLDNLRKIYDTVKFARPSLIEEPLVVETAAIEPTSIEPEAVPVVPQVEVTVIPAVEQACADPEESSMIVNSPDEKEEFEENILFAQEEIPVKPKLDKKVILSLYGDDPMPVKTEEKQSYTPAEEPVPVQDKAPVIPVQEESEPVQVLGDVLGGGGQTVADVYTENNTKTDVASVLSSGKVDGIRKSIGINDKFLIIRNLFDGNSEVYESVISSLDSFDDLDDALIYIHENFNWNPDNDAVKLVVDLLTRKLS